jgi:hypothetical protein
MFRVVTAMCERWRQRARIPGKNQNAIGVCEQPHPHHGRGSRDGNRVGHEFGDQQLSIRAEPAEPPASQHLPAAQACIAYRGWHRVQLDAVAAFPCTVGYWMIPGWRRRIAPADHARQGRPQGSLSRADVSLPSRPGLPQGLLGTRARVAGQSTPLSCGAMPAQDRVPLLPSRRGCRPLGQSWTARRCRAIKDA